MKSVVNLTIQHEAELNTIDTMHQPSHTYICAYDGCFHRSQYTHHIECTGQISLSYKCSFKHHYTNWVLVSHLCSFVCVNRRGDYSHRQATSRCCQEVMEVDEDKIRRIAIVVT